jgi:hypothetical protein
MDLASIPRPEGVSPTAVPIIVWDAASDYGDLTKRAELKANGWEPCGISVCPRPRGVLTAGGTAMHDELIVVFGFKRVSHIVWVESTEQQGEQASA